MLDIGAGTEGIDEEVRRLALLPGVFAKARIRTLKGLGYEIRTDMAERMREYRATNTHPLTARRKTKAGKWMGAGASSRAGRTWAGLAKMTRYTVDKQGTAVAVDVRDPSRAKGDPWARDAYWQAIARQREEGGTTRVTPAMRRKLAATLGRRRKGRSYEPGRDYFPLRRSTTTLHRPARPLMSLVLEAWKPRIPALFRNNFFKNVEYYRAKEAK